jgi:hypothetical protein
MAGALRTLADAGIYEVADGTKCNECRIALESEDAAWTHACKCHLVVIF